MLRRTLTAIIGIPFLLYIIISGDWILRATILVVSLIGIYEFYNAFSRKYKPIKLAGYLVATLLIITSLYTTLTFEIALGLVIIGILIQMLIQYPKYTIIDACITIFGVLYIGFFLSLISSVRDMVLGEFFVWIIFISAWGTDTFAYFTGFFFGKNKLAPVLSPKKTIEGAIGGVIGAALLGFVYTWVYGTYYNIEVMKYLFTVPALTACTSIIAQLGDLSASAIKRSLEVKDFGYILPGHGGILDRFDSVLFTSPFIYIILQLIR